MWAKKKRPTAFVLLPVPSNERVLDLLHVAVITAAATRFNLAVGTTGHCAALAVLDGNSLHSGSLSQGQWSAVERTLSCRLAAIGGENIRDWYLSRMVQ